MKVLTTVVAGFYCTPDFKAQDFGFLRKNLLNSGFHKQKVPRFRNRRFHYMGQICVAYMTHFCSKKTNNSK